MIFVLSFYKYIKIKVFQQKNLNSYHLFKINNENIKAKIILQFLN